ncbi:MAG: ROK family protein [Phycisphaerales bacterium]
MAIAEPLTVGIDLGGTKMQVGVVDARNRVIGECRRKTRGEDGLRAVVERMRESVGRACEDAGVEASRIAAVGVGAPSAIDHARGIAIRAVNLGWTNVPLRDLLRKAFGRPVSLDNDVNVAAWGEASLGAARGMRDVIAVWVGTGVGGGLVIDGRLHRGHFFTAGEIGHTVVDPAAAPGLRTIEEIASRTGIVHALRRLMPANDPSPLAKRLHEQGGPRIGSSAIAEAFGQGHPIVVSVIDHAASQLGLANLATVVCPEAIVLGGGVSEALGKPWIARVKAAFDQWVFPETLRGCRVIASDLGDDAGMLGAALQARELLKP